MKTKKNIFLAAAVLLSAVLLFLRITVAEPYWVRAEEQTVSVPRLPPEHDGLVIAMVADLHYRPAMGNGVQKIITHILHARRPDIVLLAGDFIDRRNPDPLQNVDNLTQFVTDWHGRYGTFAVSGNHDVYQRKHSWKKIARMLKNAGATVLDGSGAAVPVRGKNFQIFGVADELDAWFRMGCLPPEFDRALPVYGLIHNPEYLYSIYNTFDVIFSAHTHYGQLRFPVWGEEAFRPFLRRGWWGCGIRQHSGCTQFITSGIGMSHYPVRYHDLPKVSFITLKPK